MARTRTATTEIQIGDVISNGYKTMRVDLIFEIRDRRTNQRRIQLTGPIVFDIEDNVLSSLLTIAEED